MLYIAENLKALRKSKDWTQEEVAEAVGVSPQSVSKWERGDTYPDITLLPALANLYKVSVDTIIGMDKINETKAMSSIFKSGHDFLRSCDNESAIKVFTTALKTFPNDESLMAQLALVLSTESDTEKLKQAIDLCNCVLSGNPTEKVRHTTCATICLLYFKLGEKHQAVNAAKNLPHIRESRENILAELVGEPDVDKINSYLRFLTLGDEDNQEKLFVEIGLDMIVLCTEFDLVGKIRTLRQELGANIDTTEGLRKLPHIRIRDNVNIPYSRVKITHYADVLLDKDFTAPEKAIDEVISVLRKISQQKVG